MVINGVAQPARPSTVRASLGRERFLSSELSLWQLACPSRQLGGWRASESREIRLRLGVCAVARCVLKGVSLMAELLVRSRALRTRTQRGLLAALGGMVAASVLIAARPAEAQSVTLPPTTEPTRKVSLRLSTEDPYTVSYSDCIANDTFTFQTTLNGYQGYTLEVWAGPDDCSNLTERQSSSSATCWEVYSDTPTNAIWPVTIRVQDMIGTPTTVTGPNTGKPANCRNTQTGSTGQTVYINFMLISSETIQGTAAQYALEYDLVGPPPPTNVGAGVGDGELVLNWTASNDPDLQGYQFYCDPPPNGVKVPPAEAGTDAGADAAVEGGSTEAGTNAGCPSSVLFSNAVPPAAYKCGSVSGPRNQNGTASGLTNDTLYAVGVAGYDLVRNSGPLSGVACGTPEKINGFFNLYSQAGGKAGGGYCDIGGVPDPDELWALGGLLLAAVFRRRRRQRR
jgi:MYXO-CTERM domain-containing protein